MHKEFIPYELAVKLKELGFDEPCLGVWNIPNGKYEVTLVYEGKLHEGYINDIQSFKVCAPLWQQAFDWFREKHNLDSYVRKTTYKQWKLQINYLLQDDSPEEWEKYKSYQDCKDTQEEIRQACLEKLVELVKRRS